MNHTGVHPKTHLSPISTLVTYHNIFSGLSSEGTMIFYQDYSGSRHISKVNGNWYKALSVSRRFLDVQINERRNLQNTNLSLI